MYTTQQLMEMALTKHGITQTELAKRLGRSKQFVSLCKLGGSVPIYVASKLGKLLEPELSEAEVILTIQRNNLMRREDKKEDADILEKLRKKARKFED